MESEREGRGCGEGWRVSLLRGGRAFVLEREGWSEGTVKDWVWCWAGERWMRRVVARFRPGVGGADCLVWICMIALVFDMR